MNVFMEGTNVFTFSTLTIFFIHNGEYTHVFFNSYPNVFMEGTNGNKTVNILMEGTTFHLFNINVFFNSYRWMYSWREQMYSRFQRWRFFLFITVNILMEGTNTFLTLMCFLILTGECIHGGNKCIHVFNVDEWIYSWREQMVSPF